MECAYYLASSNGIAAKVGPSGAGCTLRWVGFQDDSKKISQARLILSKCRYTRASTELDGRTIETKILPSRRKRRSVAR